LSESQKLRHLIIRVPKDQAAFTYFQLEANEGLAFYSTLDQSLKEAYRDIEVFSPLSLSLEFANFLDHLKSEIPYNIRIDEELEDGPHLIDLFRKDGKRAQQR